MQAYTLPVRSYRRDTTASEPLEHSLSNDYDPTNARRSTTPLPFVRRRLNVPNTFAAFRNVSVPTSPSRAGQENRPPVPLSNKENVNTKFSHILTRFENGFVDSSPPARQPITPITNLPSYYSTYSLPMPTTTLSRLPQQQQQQQTPLAIPSSVPEKRAKSPYRHRTFSFESPPASPELVFLPNHGGLEITTLSSNDDLAHQAAPAIDHTQVRSTSSTYPSEGACSPELTVSPPLTFGRRILSSLEAYGFSSAHLSILQSEEEDRQQEDKDTRKSSQDLEGLYPREKKLSLSEADIAHAITASRSPPNRCSNLGSEEFVLPAPESPVVPLLLLTDHILVSGNDVLGGGEEGQGGADENASTRCLPRVSTALSFPSFDGGGGERLVEVQLRGEREREEEGHVSFGTQLRSRISGHFRRVNGHGHHFRSSSRLGGGMEGNDEGEKTRVTADVKRWLMKQFKAGRMGVRKVKRGLHGGYDSGNEVRKEKLVEEMRGLDVKLEKERRKLRKKRRCESAGGERGGKGGKERSLRGRFWGLLV
ncbi:hypothetical protein QBC40DRAFT_257670 [Triangularia verruculosa]|uniref:Uncharacterized protein n=1 Tax=Triangularia verruculosa TaxID=2587418 RepID=A0AAN6XAC4_9PEZI|nr:hypothetical protein QBC40DRAFT_257670 [Triangularia verruculosa]